MQFNQLEENLVIFKFTSEFPCAGGGEGAAQLRNIASQLEEALTGMKEGKIKSLNSQNPETNLVPDTDLASFKNLAPVSDISLDTNLALGTDFATDTNLAPVKDLFLDSDTNLSPVTDISPDTNLALDSNQVQNHSSNNED